MDFSRVEAEFERLKAQFDTGALTEAEFKAQLEELMIEDAQGQWWMIGYETGQWYYHDGEEWLQKEPPRVTAAARPTHPQHPGTAGPVPASQPGSSATAPPALKVGVKLGRDGLSVLLATAGWLISWGGPALVLPYPNWFWLAISAGTGGLITGLVLRRTEPPSPWKLVPVVAIGWIAGWLIAGIVLPDSFYFREWTLLSVVAGLIGGLLTSLALKWVQPPIQWKHVAIITLGWVLGWAIGGAISGAMAAQDRMILLIAYAVWGGIAGAVGSGVMFWQLRESGQSSS